MPVWTGLFLLEGRYDSLRLAYKRGSDLGWRRPITRTTHTSSGLLIALGSPLRHESLRKRVAFKLQWVLDMVEVRRYQRSDGSVPLTDWLTSLRDARARSKLEIRIRRVSLGLLGDIRTVGDGVLELREDVGAGYRVYLGRHGSQLVILLAGGDKGSQQADIAIAKSYWLDWKRRES